MAGNAGGLAALHPSGDAVARFADKHAELIGTLSVPGVPGAPANPQWC